MTARQDLANFALRQLGKGAINIEITDDQIEDCLTLAVQYYQDYHPDGFERDYVTLKISPTSLTVADTSGFSVGDTITTTQGASAVILSIVGLVISTDRNSGVAFANSQTITNGTASTTITTAVLGELDKKYFDLTGTVTSVLKIYNATTFGGKVGDLWGVQYQFLAPEILRMLKDGGGQGLSYYYHTMSYLSDLDFIFKHEKSFRFNRRMNKLFLDIAWETELNVGDNLVIEIYRTVDPDTYNEVYTDLWLRKYVTALFKKQWGANLKKYKGMQLPGGLTYDGQTIFDEAKEEIKELEERLMTEEPPLGFFIG